MPPLQNAALTPFKIALVAGGGVSAGAYSAGVLDFLIEALEAWEVEKEKGTQGVPRHAVEIPVIAGSSAGSICAGILTASNGRHFKGATPGTQPPPGSSRLYNIWVKEAKLLELLKEEDLKDGEPVKSLLDSSYLNKQAKTALTFDPAGYVRPKYISETLDVFLTYGNLRGATYRIPFSGGGGHDMTMHGDHQHYYLSANADQGRDSAGGLWLSATQQSPLWTSQFRDNCLASGAFPIGLAARKLTTHGLRYSMGHWAVPWEELPPIKSAYGVGYKMTPISPVFPPSGPEYVHIAVDGGIANNEPFDIARRQLAGGEYRNPRDGDAATRAVLLIDPFPEPFDPSEEYQADADILSVAMALLGAWKNNARFKIEDLALAQHEDVYSRFMIAPVRKKSPEGKPETYALASSGLAGFGGFFDEQFRQHDYDLGRLNCRLFLEKHFNLYSNNPIFGPEPVDPKWIWDHPSKPGVKLRAIIPLVGHLEVRDGVAPPIKVPVFPQMSRDDFNVAMEAADKRTDAVVSRLRKLMKFKLKIGTWAAWALFGGSAKEKIREKVVESFCKVGVLPPGFK